MTSIASLSSTPSPYTSHSRKGIGRSLARAGQSLLAGAGTAAANALATGINASANSTGLKAIQNAVTAALQNARQNSSTADPDQVIKNTIKGLFNSGLVTPDQATSGLADDSTNSTTPGASTTAPTTFQQILQSFGVSPDQFRKDLAAAIQETTGNSNATTPSQTITPGALLNVIA